MTRKDVFGLLRAVVSSAAMFIAGGVIQIVGALATMLAPVPLRPSPPAGRMRCGAALSRSPWPQA